MPGRTWIIAALAALCACLVTAPATAQGPEPSWSGFYGGGHLGYGQAGLNITENHYPQGSGNLEDLTYGLLGGLNLRLGERGVIGLEGDYAWTNMDGPIAGNTYGVDATASLRARIGYLLLPQTLVYLTGGGVYTQFEYVGLPIQPPAPAPALPQVFIEDWVWGYILGLGLEQQVLDFLRVRFEYRYSDYPNWEFIGGSDAYDVESDLHEIRFGFVIPIGTP
jgi:high affinity Mn2+ porin